MDTYPGHELVEGGDGGWVGRSRNSESVLTTHYLSMVCLLREFFVNYL